MEKICGDVIKGEHNAYAQGNSECLDSLTLNRHNPIHGYYIYTYYIFNTTLQKSALTAIKSVVVLYMTFRHLEKQVNKSTKIVTALTRVLSDLLMKGKNSTSIGMRNCGVL